MKVKVLKKFRDKKENIIRRKDAIFECSEERYEEICATNKNLVAVVERSEETIEEPDETVEKSEETIEEPDETVEKSEEQAEEPEENAGSSGSVCDIARLEDLTKKELQELAKEKGTKGVSAMNRLELLDALKQ